MHGLESKAIFILGAGQGLGAAIAKRLMDEGAKVGLGDINRENVEATASHAPELSRAYHVDVTKSESVSRAIQDFARETGKLDGLVNSAMWIRYEPVELVEEAAIDKMLAVGFKGAFFAVQAALPFLSERGGSVINFSSPAAEVAIANASIYCGVKGAIAALTRQLAMELGEKGVRVNSLAPGPVKTPGASAVVSDEGYDLRARQTPLGRLGEPDEIAAAAAFLLSDDGAFVSGENLRVDGALTIATISKS